MRLMNVPLPFPGRSSGMRGRACASADRGNIPYIGLLGAADRRKALLGSLGKDARRLERRSYGPVGLDIGAESPEEIALSIISGIQAFLQGRSGGVLAAPRSFGVTSRACKETGTTHVGRVSARRHDAYEYGSARRLARSRGLFAL